MHNGQFRNVVAYLSQPSKDVVKRMLVQKMQENIHMLCVSVKERGTTCCPCEVAGTVVTMAASENGLICHSVTTLQFITLQ